jgi:hypothetical protein
MLFYVAKLLQLVGFAHVGYALFVGLTEANAMSAELRLLMLGVVIFWVGRVVESRAGGATG